MIRQTAALDVLAERFGVEVVEADTKELLGRSNGAPSRLVPIVIAPDGRRRLLTARWGLRPFWARYDKIAPTNVRAETVATSRMFREVFRYARCLIPADGFYEWQAVPGPKRKRPHFFRLKGGGQFALAGLYTPPRPDEDILATCAIITTIRHEVAAPIYNRMPVILDPSHERRWLNPFFVTAADVLRCLLPLPPERIEAFPVSALVFTPGNEGVSTLGAGHSRGP